METKLMQIEHGRISASRPDIIVDLLNGRGDYNYNFDIEDVNAETSDNGEITIVNEQTETSCRMYRYKTIRIEGIRTANHILQQIMSALFPDNVEMKFLNEYNAAKIGLAGGSATSAEAKVKIAAYREFLEERMRIKAMVDADCQEINIPNSNE